MDSKKMLVFLFVVTLFFVSHTAMAGTIFIDRASWLGAFSDPLVANEDFESFAIGPVSSPLSIMGGIAEVLDTSPSIDIFTNTVGGPSPTQAWIGNVSNPFPLAIRGIGDTALGFTAFGFDYAHQSAGFWRFTTSLGTDDAPGVGSGAPVLDSFVGWVGNPGELLAVASYGAGGIILDNIDAAAVPVPSTLLLLGFGLVGLGLFRRRKKAA